MNILIFTNKDWGCVLPPQDSRAIHIRTILGSSVGQELQIGLLGGGTGSAKIRKIDSRGTIELDFPSIESLTPPKALVPVHIILGHPRPPVLRRLFKDLASFGIEKITVCGTELSEKSYFSSHLWTKEQYKLDLLDGAQQGAQCLMPEVNRYWSIKEYCDKEFCHKEFGKSEIQSSSRFVLDLDSRVSYLHQALPGLNSYPLVLAIGPERGWTDSERLVFQKHGFTTIQLGSGIWRTETACIYAAGFGVQFIESQIPKD